MRCPYCNQEHPDQTLFCPVTGHSMIVEDMQTAEQTMNDPSKEVLPEKSVPMAQSSPGRAVHKRQSSRYTLIIVLSVIGIAVVFTLFFFIWRQYLSIRESEASYVGVHISIGLTQTAMVISNNNLHQPVIIQSPTVTATDSEISPTPTISLSLSTTAVETQPGLSPTNTPAITLTTDSMPTVALTSSVPLPLPLTTISSTPLAAGTQTPSGTSCIGAISTLLSPGVKAKVSDVVVVLNLRGTAGVNGTMVGSLKPNDQVLILNEQPVCLDNYLWWHIQSADAKLYGWAAEGNASQYWLVSVP